MGLILDIFILIVRVAVFVALILFLCRYVRQQGGDVMVRRVRRLVLALIASDALLYANLIYGKLATIAGFSIRDLSDLGIIFATNVIAGGLALWALRGMYKMENHG